jgi:hypothetical protein
MSIMRTKGQGYIVMNSTPNGKNFFKELYDMNEKKLHIKNYDKDLMRGAFYGWDVISADEIDDSYLFQLKNRLNNSLRVYITLGRELQVAPVPYYPELMYQVYMHDDNGEWDYTGWFRGHDLTYKNFWAVIEDIVEKHHPTDLPF